MNKRYAVELTTLAREQILQMADYIANVLQSPEAAERLIDKLEAEIATLGTMPERVVLVEREPWHSKGVHKFIIDEHIAYFIILEPEATVRVIAVVPGRMDQEKQLKKTAGR